MLKFFLNKKEKKSEKRRFERFDFIQSTFYKLPDTDKVVECFLNNISIGGLSFDTKDNELSVNDTIILMYKIKTTMKKDTLIIRHIQRVFNNWRIGCEFKDEDPERNTLIIDFLQ
jgi:hypothetical protein